MTTTNAFTPTATPELTQAHAPGKLILSGEHSVLYGAPALAMAVARYTEVWFRPQSVGEGLKTAFANLSAGEVYPLRLLSQFKSSLDRKFDQFMRGELAVHKIMSRPDDLAVYTLASLLHDHPHHETSTLPGIGASGHMLSPGQLGSQSALPLGAGMGSSAAIVAATTVLFENLLNRPKTLDQRYERVRFCERLKHGRAGPIDAATVVRGGLVRASLLPTGDSLLSTPQVATDHGLLKGEGWYWVLHGRPESSTGECVAAVKERHGQDNALWEAFAACTNAFLEALEQGSAPDAALVENQRLLETIGVVPQVTQSFIAGIRENGGSAKICGAGSVRGDQGGVVLVHMPDPAKMTRFMADHHPSLQWAPLQMAPQGAGLGPAPGLSQFS